METAVYQIGVFRLDCGRFELLRDGYRIKLERKPLELLILLLEGRDRLVTREEIAQRLWSSDVFVDTEHGINTAIRKLRQALRDDADNPRFIETVPGIGYRFIARVQTETAISLPIDTDAPSAKHSGSQRLLWFCLISTVVVIAAAAWIALKKTPQPIQSLAVLPLGGDQGAEYFQDGITEELSDELSTIPGLRVASRSAVMQWKGSPASLDSIARALDVQAVVTGSVQRSKGGIVLNLLLFDARSNRDLGRVQLSDSSTNIIEIRQTAVRQIADQTRISLSAATRNQLNRHEHVDPAAFDGYLEGRYLLSKRDVERAVPLFQRAVVLDPAYAPAWAGLASALADSAMGSDNPLDGPARDAIAAADHAIQLDPLNGEAWSVRGMVAFSWQWDWNAAEQDLRRAIVLSPGDSIPELHYATFLSLTGHGNESVEHMKRALALDPLSFLNMRHMGSVYYWTRHYDQSLDFLRRAEEMEPDLVSFVEPWQSKAYEMKGMPAEAITADLHSLTFPDRTGWRPRLIAAYQSGNRLAYWETKLKMLKAFSNQTCTSFDIAGDYSHLGRHKEALDWLERALDEHCFLVVSIKADPIFDGLRAEPRFESVLKRVHLND